MFRRQFVPGSNLHLICNAVAGCSLGCLALIAEDKRRRIVFLQRVLETHKIIQQFQAYRTAAAVDLPSATEYDVLRAGNISLPAHRWGQLQASAASTDESCRPETKFGGESSLQNDIERAEQQKGRVSSERRLRLSSNSHHQERQIEPCSLGSETVQARAPRVRHDVNKCRQEYTSLVSPSLRKTQLSVPSRHPILPAKTPPSQPRAAPVGLCNGSKREPSPKRFARDESICNAIKIKYTTHLQKLLALRVKECLSCSAFHMHDMGLHELSVYLKYHQGSVIPQLRDAVRLSWRNMTALSQRDSQWKCLLQSAISEDTKNDDPRGPALAIENHASEFGLSCSPSQLGYQQWLAAHIHDCIRTGSLFDAYFELLNLFETLTNHINSKVLKAIGTLVSALRAVGAFCVVKDIHMKLLELNDLRIDPDNLMWIIRHEIPQNASKFCLPIVRKLFRRHRSSDDVEQAQRARDSFRQMFRFLHERESHTDVIDLAQCVGFATACKCVEPEIIYSILAESAPIKTAQSFIEFLPLLGKDEKCDKNHASPNPSSRVRLLHAHCRLLRRCWQSTGNLGLTEEIFNAIESKTSKAIVMKSIYHILISAYVEAGKVDEAESKVDEVLRKTSEKSIHVQMTAQLMLAQVAMGRWNALGQSWEKLQKDNDATAVCRKQPGLFNHVIEQCCKQQTAKQAVSYVLDLSRRLGFTLTRTMTKSLMHTVIHQQDEEALLALLNHLQSNKLQPLFWMESFQLLSSRSQTRSHSGSQGGSQTELSVIELRPLHTKLALVPPRNGGALCQSKESKPVWRIMQAIRAEKKPVEVLKTYRNSLQGGLPQHRLELDFAAKAMLDLKPDSPEKAAALLKSAEASGVKPFRTHLSLLLHSIRNRPSALPTHEAVRIINSFYRASAALPIVLPLNHHVTLAIVRHLLHRGKQKAARRIMLQVQASNWAKRQPFEIREMTLLLEICTMLGPWSGLEGVMREVLDRDLRIDKRFFVSLRAARNRYLRAPEGQSLKLGRGQKASEIASKIESYLEKFRERRGEQIRKSQEFQRKFVDAVRQLRNDDRGQGKVVDTITNNQRLLDFDGGGQTGVTRDLATAAAGG